VGEVVQTTDSTVLTDGIYTLQKPDFFTQVHDHTIDAFDCLVSSDGGSRIAYANYASPSDGNYSNRMMGQCSGPADSHLDLTAADSGGNHGIDGALMMSSAPTGADPDENLALQVNWYSDIPSLTLYTSTGNTSQVKFGRTDTWVYNGYGRSGQSPGPNYCYTDCGHTNKVSDLFKERLWLR